MHGLAKAFSSCRSRSPSVTSDSRAVGSRSGTRGAEVPHTAKRNGTDLGDEPKIHRNGRNVTAPKSVFLFLCVSVNWEYKHQQEN